VGSDDPLILRAITYYQAASYGFKQQLLGWKAPKVAEPAISAR
jgi:hypothetical protein